MKIDINCGDKKRERFVGLGQYLMPGVDHVLDIGTERWPFADGSVNKGCPSNVLEHLTNLGERFEREHLLNGLSQVPRPRANGCAARCRKCTCPS